MLPVTGRLLAIMPFLFGTGFLAPLIAQMLQHAGVGGAWGLSTEFCGLVIGGGWGLIANLRGRWL